MTNDVDDDRNKIPSAEDNDLASNLEYLSRRVNEENGKTSEEFRAKAEEREGLEKLKEEVDWARDVIRFGKQHTDHEPNYPYLSTYSAALIKQFDEHYPLERKILIGPSWHTSGSPISTGIYSWLSANPASFEPEQVYNEYCQKLSDFEHRRDAESRKSEVSRRLCWLDENASCKFDSAWKNLTVGATLPDPGEGPTMLMRSAIELTVEHLYGRVPQPSKRLVKGKRLKHVAQHAARDDLAREKIIAAADRYVDLTSELSKFKGITVDNLNCIRSLLYQGQDLLFDILDSIEYHKLAPHRKL